MDIQFLIRLFLMMFIFKKVSFNKLDFTEVTFKCKADFLQSSFNGITSFIDLTLQEQQEKPIFIQCTFKDQFNIEQKYLRYSYNEIKKIQEANTDNKEIKESPYRDLFRRLKSNRLAHHNLIDASELHTQELYAREIELQNKQIKTLKDHIDKLQLWFYRMTSDHHTDLAMIFNNTIMLIALFGVSLFIWRYHDNIDYLQDFINAHKNNGFVDMLSNNLLKPKYFDMTIIIGFIVSACLFICELVLFFVDLHCKFYNFCKYYRIFISWIFCIVIILVNPKYILGIGGFIGGSIKATGAIENILFVIYSIIMFLLLFSLQKTARKNSIIPS